MSDKEGYVTIPVGRTDVPNSNGVIYPKEAMGKGYNPGSDFFNKFPHAEPISRCRGSYYMVNTFGKEYSVFIPDVATPKEAGSLAFIKFKELGLDDDKARCVADNISTLHTNKVGVGATQLVGRSNYDETPYIHDPKTEKESDTPRQMEGDSRRQLLITKSGFTYPQPKSRR